MLFMCATGEKVGAPRSENAIGEKSRKDKTCIVHDGPEATTHSALTVDCALPKGFNVLRNDRWFFVWLMVFPSRFLRFNQPET
jgi:hypothetical protein